jgi:hypothetical protein
MLPRLGCISVAREGWLLEMKEDRTNSITLIRSWSDVTMSEAFSPFSGVWQSSWLASVNRVLVGCHHVQGLQCCGIIYSADR